MGLTMVNGMLQRPSPRSAIDRALACRAEDIQGRSLQLMRVPELDNAKSSCPSTPTEIC